MGEKLLLTTLLIFGLLTINHHSEAQDLHFSTLSIKEGLPTNIISGITQDRYGFLWVSTNSGLARYDGNKFSIFRKSPLEGSLPSNLLTDLLSHGNELWVGTWNGLCKINIRTLEITRVDLGNITIIRTLHLGKDNNLWIGSGSGIIRYDLNTGNYQVYSTENSNLSHNMIRSIYQDRVGTVWVGTFDGLNYMREGQTKFTRISLPTKENGALPNLLVLDIKPSINEDPNLWIGTEQGLFRVHTQRMEVLPIELENDIFSNNVIKTIFPDDQGKLWLGTDFGLNIYDPISKENTQHFHHPILPYSIANNVIWKIHEDQNGVIWLATSNGLSKVNKKGDFYSVHDISYTTKGQSIGNQIKSLIVSRSGDYWLATQHGVIKMDPKTSSKTIFTNQDTPDKRLIMNNISDLLEDQKGRIWIGTAGGINIWNPASKQMEEIRADSINGLQSNYIGHFCQEPDGTIWVSAWQGGLYRIGGTTGSFDKVYFEEVLDLESSSEKFVYGDRYIWTIEYDELYRIDPETLQAQPIPTFNKTVEGRMINTLYFSDNGEIWAGTLNGLIQYNPKTDSLAIHDVLSVTDEIISSIIEDTGGNIWSVSNSSIQKYEPTTGQLHSYPLDSHLPIKSFYYNCAARREDGQLLFGGDNGFISFSPFQVEVLENQPPVYITHLDINNRPIKVNDTINGRVLLDQDISFIDELALNFNERSFALQFSTLDFLQPEHNRHTYQLQGFEDVWHQVSGTKNTAVYSNVPAGDYTFLVKSINLNGQNEPAIRRLNITILPPFLLRWYFILCYAFIILVLLYFAIKTYSGRVKLTNELNISKLKVEHAQELEKTKENFFTNISHELRTPISLILPPLHQLQVQQKMDEKSSKLIQLAEKNASRLLKLVNQVLDFNRMANNGVQLHLQEVDLIPFCHQVFILFEDTARRHHIKYDFELSCNDTKLWADPDKLETVLFNLLSNAFKFTPDYGKISVRISEITSEKSQINECQIEVTDSGAGIEEAAQKHIFDRFFQASAGKQHASGSGIGLTLVQEYVSLHQGNISVKSQLQQGSSFLVILPLGKAHLSPELLAEEQQNSQEKLPSHSIHSNLPEIETASDKTTILLIDDNDDILDFITTSLGDKYHFITAENGEEGLFKANRFLPNVIISDITMPVMDGISFCKKIKESPKTSPISIILLTAKSLPTNQLEGIQVGADAYLTKPFEISLLEAYIDQLLARRTELSLYFNKELMGISDHPRGIDNEDNAFVKRVMEIIEANISNPALSVEMISQQIAMSSTHLYRKLKANTDHSAKELIQKYRLKKASLLLQNKEGNVSEIVYQVGFNSPSYFSRAFKSEYGISPKQYQDKFNRKK
ncbi:two-component regulator propeller domain-containing protein [Algoriphagus sp. D3-2-R+10]|uniref:hybrid sensor histidine kinase/response regulator transcription factor n=1 Tax=Algoriphagus aurantiacus TaxID=3103948 RepID=UPI002B3F00AA|nr:two-component regulator propeller domain-containing protein [Algoriphagus sp. D3-2-R+10]MEB2774664.1 two-component regulator propeller domain-containing protein [Algoriphagus sp. D3-2-R+10]